MRYRAYNKRALCAAMAGYTPVKGPSILEFSKWPQWWEAGAKELEKTSPGRLITAPVRLPEAVVTASTKTVKEVPGVVRSAGVALPVLGVAAALVGASYLVYRFKREKAVSKQIISGCDN